MSYLVAKILVFSRLGQNIASYNSDIKRENSYERNHLTNSKFRYEFWLKKRKHEPQLRLDGPTYKWVYEALKMTYSIRKVKQSFTIPTLLLEASFDKVVDNSVNIEVLKNFSHLQQENFFYAKHELLNEIDYIRENAMKRIFDFIEKQ
jgi:lysophospholipase